VRLVITPPLSSYKSNEIAVESVFPLLEYRVSFGAVSIRACPELHAVNRALRILMAVTSVDPRVGQAATEAFAPCGSVSPSSSALVPSVMLSWFSRRCR